MKTFTAQEFEIVFYKAMAEWAQGGKIGKLPRGNWEYRYSKSEDWKQSSELPHTPSFDDLAQYRWKPAKKRTVVIDGVELVAPEVDAPVKGATYFCEYNKGNTESYSPWGGAEFEYEALKNGKVFLNREDCQAMADAQRKQRMGGVL